MKTQENHRVGQYVMAFSVLAFCRMAPGPAVAAEKTDPHRKPVQERAHCG